MISAPLPTELSSTTHNRSVRLSSPKSILLNISDSAGLTRFLTPTEKVSDGSQPPMTSDFSEGELAGSHSLQPVVGTCSARGLDSVSSRDAA